MLTVVIDPGLAQLEGLPCPVPRLALFSFFTALPSPPVVSCLVCGLWGLSLSSSLVSELGLKVTAVLGDNISCEGDGTLEFKFRLRLGFGPSPSSSFLSSSSSSSVSSSWIWLSTGALIRDVKRFPEEGEEDLQRSTTWVSTVVGGRHFPSPPYSSSSSSTLKRLGLRGLQGPPAARGPRRCGMDWGLASGRSPLSGVCRTGCWLDTGACLLRRRLTSNSAVFGLGPLWRLSALRAGDWGPPGWEIVGPPNPSLTSWWTSTLVGHDCL